MKIYSGIDEAGLGPILGPFCATAITLESPEPPEQLFKDIPKEVFYVDDSKKVYQGKYGLKRLELNVLGFYYLLNEELPENLLDFIPSLRTEPFKKCIKLPVAVNRDEIIEKATAIGNIFKERGANILDIKRSVVPAVDFNKLLDYWNNKSIACQKIINPLLLNLLKHGNDHIVVIDKQGGRKFYQDYLIDLLKRDDIAIIKEENNHSLYNFDRTDINFKAKADSDHFTVALASMFSKYMREISMKSFNLYWEERHPVIKATAGYYKDGMRFISELKESGLLPSEIDLLIRKK